MPEKRRPFGVTLLLWMVLILTAWGMVRLIATLRGWNVLVEFETSLSPLYLSMTGAGWGAAGSVLLVGILRRKQWAAPSAVIAIWIWLIEYWIERLFFQSDRANLPFVLTSSILVGGIVVLLANLPGTRSFFAKSEEHEQSVEKPDIA